MGKTVDPQFILPGSAMNMWQAPSKADEEILEEREDPLPVVLAVNDFKLQPARLNQRILRLHHNSLRVRP